MPTPLDPELVDQIRESLYTGRGVRLFGDESPVAKLDVLAPMVKSALEQGAAVAIEADGSLVIDAATTPKTVPAATAAAQFAEFERPRLVLLPPSVPISTVCLPRRHRALAYSGG